MTRLEQKEKKLKEEKQFVELIKNTNIDGTIKDKFRRTSIWKTFRKYMFEKSGKRDPITNIKLPKSAPLHHMNLDPKKYTELDEDNFLVLSKNSHDCLHYFYTRMCIDGDTRAIDNLKKYVIRMYELNNGKDIKDFKNID